jgi:hypothetical protein
MFDFFVFLFFVVSWEIHCTRKGNVVQTLGKASRTLAFFPLAMQGWCILSILVMGENHPLDHRPHWEQGNVP